MKIDSSSSDCRTRAATAVSAFCLFAAVIAYRAAAPWAAARVPWLMNFSPLAAVALCGAIYLPRRLSALLPLTALCVSDLFLNWHYGAALLAGEMPARWAALGLMLALGWMVRARSDGRPGALAVLGTSVAGSFGFYFLTNSASWLHEPGYAKTLAGWMQALTTGLPGYAPTWWFFRNSAASDLTFTALFMACMSAARASGGMRLREEKLTSPAIR